MFVFPHALLKADDRLKASCNKPSFAICPAGAEFFPLEYCYCSLCIQLHVCSKSYLQTHQQGKDLRQPMRATNAHLMQIRPFKARTKPGHPLARSWEKAFENVMPVATKDQISFCFHKLKSNCLVARQKIRHSFSPFCLKGSPSFSTRMECKIGTPRAHIGVKAYDC